MRSAAWRRARFHASLIVFAVIGLALVPRTSAGDEHAGHHPVGGEPAPPAAPVASAAGGGMAGGMGGMMAGMMPPSPAGGGCAGGDCGSGGPKTPIYPSLMTLSELTPAKRAEIDALATQQVDEGMAKLAKGSDSLNVATKAGDNVTMQQSIGLIREGLDELSAGIAARRVLAEGTPPRNLALQWFKREMSLASPVPRDAPRMWLGVTPFHLFTMVLLIAFGLAMVAMYFAKMRRAAALFGRLEASSGGPPPGQAPPLGGNPEPTKSQPNKPEPTKPESTKPEATKPEATKPEPPPAGKAPPPAPAASPPTSKGGTPGEPAASASAATSSPATANWRGQLRIGSIVAETPTVKTLRLLPTSGDALPFTFVPGQFLNLAFWVGGAKMNRSYSISSSPNQRDYVELTIRREPRGAVSRHIDDLLEVGDSIETGGPVGRFTFAGTEADSIVLIAAGVGITPMMSISRFLTEIAWPGDIFLIYACRAPTDFIFEKELAALQQRNPKLHVVVTMSRPEGTAWKGPRGRITKDLLAQTVPDLASRRVHLCGPPSMMDATKALLTELGVPAEQVKTEAFGATKPSPPPAGASPKPTAPADGPLITFSKNGKSARIHTDQTILELSEELGIGIEFSCRVGTCGICKVKMTSGEVDMAVQDALDADDKTKGIILACQAKPKGDITVEA